MNITLKTPEQIAKIDEANAIIYRLYKEILPEHMVPGMTGTKLNKIIEDYVISEGAKPATIGVGGPYNPYPAGSCISVNNEVIHGIPKDSQVFKEGDIVSVDVVTDLDGYFGDAAYTYPIGEISAEAQKLIDVTKRARDIGMEQTKLGNRLGDIGNAIERYVRANGFSVVKDFCGHGVGLSMHEEPAVPNFGKKNTGFLIEEGLVIAIEPMVNEGSGKVKIESDGWTATTKDDKLSAHFEFSVAIVDGKRKILGGFKIGD